MIKIDVLDLVKVEGASAKVEVLEIPEGIQALDEAFVFEGPVKFLGTLSNISGVLTLKGHLDVDFKTSCYRCLNDANGHIGVDVEEIFSKQDSDDAYTYANNHILLDKVLVDNIILNLPMKQLCKEDCSGLCSICGQALNTTVCDCTTKQLNPKMDALKNFFNN